MGETATPADPSAAPAAERLPDPPEVRVLRRQLIVTPDGRGRARLLLDLAVALRDGDRPGEAVAAALAAAGANLEIGRTAKAARAYRIAALVLLQLGRSGEAVTRLLEGRDRLAEARASQVVLAGCDVTLAEGLRAVGRPAAALRRLEVGRAAFLAHSHEELLPGFDHDRAVLYSEIGQTGKAVELLAEARKALLRARDREAVAACDHNLGLALHDLGQLDDAVEYFLEGRSIFSALGSRREAASCNMNLGVVLHDMGRDVEARRRLEEARDAFAELGAERSAAECDHNLSVVLRVLGERDASAAHAARAAASGIRSPEETGPLPVIPEELAEDRREAPVETRELLEGREEATRSRPGRAPEAGDGVPSFPRLNGGPAARPLLRPRPVDPPSPVEPLEWDEPDGA